MRARGVSSRGERLGCGVEAKQFSEFLLNAGHYTRVMSGSKELVLVATAFKPMVRWTVSSRDTTGDPPCTLCRLVAVDLVSVWDRCVHKPHELH